MELFLCEPNSLCEHLEAVSNYKKLESTIDISNINNELLSKHINGESSPYEINGSVAVIKIEGYLSNERPSLFQRLCGYKGTSYYDIISSIQSANESNASEIELHINSPGGSVGIVDNVWQAIRNSKKKVTAIANGMIASGAYYIASAASEIISINPINMIGSIGVIVAGYEYSEMMKKFGIKYVSISSDNAPKKGLGIDTEDGISEIKKNVNAVEALFISRVAEGRNVSVEKVKKDFGNGGVMVAYDIRNSEEKLKDKQNYIDAVSSGMIDSVIGIQEKEDKKEEEEVQGSKEKIMGATPEEIKEIEDRMTAKFQVEMEATAFEASLKYASSILKSSVYSADSNIRSIAVDVMSGKASIEKLSDAISDYDKNIASKDLEAAKDKENQNRIKSEEFKNKSGEKFSNDGVIRSEEDLEKCMDFGG